MDYEAKNFNRSSNLEIITGSSRADLKFENNFTAASINIPECTIIEVLQGHIDPHIAKEARKKRKETIQRRRGLMPSTTAATAPSQSCRDMAEEAVAAVTSYTSAISMAEVQKTAQQLAGDMKNTDILFSAGPFRRTVSLNAIRPPSPVYSCNEASDARKPRSNADDFKSSGATKPQSVTSSSTVPDKVVSSGKKRSKSAPTPRKRTQKKAALSAELAAIVKPRRTAKKSTERTPLEITVAAIESTPLPEGDDPESRRQRRLIRNRMSAQLHRERKREAMNTLQRMIEEREERIQTLERQLHQVPLLCSSFFISIVFF